MAGGLCSRRGLAGEPSGTRLEGNSAGHAKSAYNWRMVWFTSHRERRLWACALAVIVAIYATLGLARTLAQFLNGTGLGERLFVVACLLVLLVVLTRGWTSRPGIVEIAVAIGVGTAYLLVFVRMAVPTERSHLIEYGILAILIYEALLERVSQGKQVPVPGCWAIVIASAVGVIDEAIQAVWPGRFCDPVDMLFNVLAAAMAVAATAALAWARRIAATRKGPPSYRH